MNIKQLQALTVQDIQGNELPGSSESENTEPKILLFGSPKSGKSTFFAQNSAVAFLPFCPGLARIERKKIQPLENPLITSYAELIVALKQVRHSRHEFDLLVVDTVDGMIELALKPHVLEKECGGKIGGKNGFNSYGKGWNGVSIHLQLILTALEQISKQRGMKIAFISHCQFSTIEDPVHGAIDLARTTLPKTVWSLLHGWVDVILRMVSIPCVDKDGNPLPVPNQLYTKSLPACVTGCREGFWLPDVIPTDWQNFCELLESNKKPNLIKTILEYVEQNPTKKEKVNSFLGTQDLESCQSGELYKLTKKL